MAPAINPDQIGRVTTKITAAMTAARYSKGDTESYPELLASPVMIGEMERACAQLLQPILSAQDLSVGVQFELRHVAPTPVGSELVCEARFERLDAPLYWFEVTARDEAGEVGRGRHARAIVNRADIEARAQRRIERAGGQGAHNG